MSLLSSGLSLSVVLLDGNLSGLWILVAGPAVLGVAALVGAMAMFAQASRSPQGGARIAWYVVGALMLTLALGIGACFGVVMLG
jgi:cytochrome c oxidase assembly factor CtaG